MRPKEVLADPAILVISGASGGVGRALVRHFLDRNAQVFGIDKHPLNEEGQFSNYRHIQADLSQWEDVKKARDIVKELTSRVDILVNGAGMFLEDSMEEHGIRIIPSILWQNNTLSCLTLSIALHPLLLMGRNPLVVNISSVDGVVASAGQECEVAVSHDIFYATSKGAIITLTKALAMKWARQGIRVNAICPTVIRSPMTADLLSIPNKEAELTKHIPLGRLCEPADIAVAVECLYYLEMTTAHVLTIDGGYLCQ